jgi:hypothetical protein
MDFSTNRGGQPTAAPIQPAPRAGKKLKGRGMRIISAVLLISIALLVASLAVYLGFSSDGSESKYVNKDKFQAVFLNGGQVYFGKIRTLNNSYITLDNIYYLRVNNSSDTNADANNASAQDVSLAKLGCELHGPEDKMVINRDQVTFWENLKDDGQVTKAISEFVKANPQGQKCTDTTANNTSNTGTKQ